MNIIIHLADHASADRAILFPEDLVPELITRVKALKTKGRTTFLGDIFDWDGNGTWDWFCKHSTPTTGVEDAEYFLDYYNPIESVLEWEEDVQA